MKNTSLIMLFVLFSISLSSAQNNLNTFDTFSTRLYCGLTAIFKTNTSTCDKVLNNKVILNTNLNLDNTNTNIDLRNTIISLQNQINAVKNNPAKTEIKYVNTISNGKEIVYVAGPKGEKGDSATVSNISTPNNSIGSVNNTVYMPTASYGGAYLPATNNNPSNYYGISTIGYLNGATIDKSIINDSTANNISINSGNATLTNGVIANITNNNLNTQNASITNLLFANGTGTNLKVTNLNSTQGNITNLSGSNLNYLNATNTNLFSQNASITNATTTNFFASIFNAVAGYFTDLFATNATVTNLTVSNLNASNTLTNLNNILTSNIGGSVATSSVISNNDISFSTSTSLLTSNVNGFISTTTLAGAMNNWYSQITNQPATSNTENIYTLGNVGIGTSTPMAKLSIDDNNSSNYSVISSLNNQNTNGWSSLQFLNGTSSSWIGQVGSTNAYTNVRNRLAIMAWTDGITLMGNNDIRFYTQGWTHTGYERMRITANGNIGIGTSTPNNKLEITASTANTSGLRFTNLTSSFTPTATSSNFLTVNASGDVISAIPSIASSSLTGFVNGQLAFGTTTGGLSQSSNVAFDSTNNSLLIGGGSVATVASAVSSSTATQQKSRFTVTGGDAAINTLTVGLGGGQIAINQAVGLQALYNNTTGANNTANGAYTLFSNTTGVNNLASGYQANYLNTTGSYNVAEGVQSLYNNTTGSYNNANGYQALYNNISGSNNVASGYQSLFSNTTGFKNIAYGQQALFSNTTGVANTAIGHQTLYLNATGSQNTANGYQALYNNISGSNNVANGMNALFSNTTGISNVANGYQSLYSNTTGNNNAANGAYSLSSNTTGAGNTGNGYGTLYSNTTGSNNTANGYNSLYLNTTGTNNSSNGYSSLYSNTTGSNNVANGYASLYSNTIGANNVASGYQTLYLSTTGGINTALGYRAGYSLTAGDNNIAIGANTDFASTTGSNQLNIGNAIFGTGLTGNGNGNIGIGTATPTEKLSIVKYTSGTSNGGIVASILGNSSYTSVGKWSGLSLGNQYQKGGLFFYDNYNNYGRGDMVFALRDSSDSNNVDITDEKMRITSAGNVGIGTTTPSTKLQVVGDIRVGTTGTNGCIQGFGGATLIGTCTSDERLKTNVSNVSNVLDKFNDLRVINYNWNQAAADLYKNDMSATQTGYLAQNVESLFPELVVFNADGYRQVNYSAMGLYAVEAVKELNNKAETGFSPVASSSLASWTDINNINSLTDSIKNETPRNALTFIKDKFSTGYKAIADFTALRVTAIQGYFENLFAKKATIDELCLKKADGSYACLNGDDIQKFSSSVINAPVASTTNVTDTTTTSTTANASSTEVSTSTSTTATSTDMVATSTSPDTTTANVDTTATTDTSTTATASVDTTNTTTTTDATATAGN